MLNKPELLSPAGNFDCLKAAISAGANAVYLGGKNFSARAFAGNFDNDELVEAIKYAHLRDVKVYLTINTLLNEKELENAKKQVKFYYDNNVDALLIQDLGLYYWISTNFPDFELHCSTQMHVSNIEGIKTARKLGFSRVVIPRESDLHFIKEACKQEIEIETFVHGAICVSYSGQCLMSAFTKNRSANKGMCAQCCRLKYKLLDSQFNQVKTDTEYLLSTKDMCLINDIPALIDAGVSSFKIEGRMKSPAYVAAVTSLYRKAIDSYVSGTEYKISDVELNKLKAIFNRNFTNDYLYGKDDLFGQQSPNHLGLKIGNTIGYRNGKLLIKLSDTLNQFDGIRVSDFGCIINRLYKNGLLVNTGHKGDVVSIDCKANVKGDVFKTLDYSLEKQAVELKDSKLPINISVSIYPNDYVKASISYKDQLLHFTSNIKAATANNVPLNYDTVFKQFKKLNDTVYELESLSVDTENAFLSIGDLNSIRRELIEEFDSYRLTFNNRHINSSSVNYEELVHDTGNEIDINEYICDYVINDSKHYSDHNKVIISEVGGLFRENESKIANYTLNCFNSYSYEFLRRMGFDKIILSLEIKDFELQDMMDSYLNRTGFVMHPLVYRNGNKILMYLHSDPFRKYVKDNKQYYLSDGTNIYKVSKTHNVTELSENTDECISFIQR